MVCVCVIVLWYCGAQVAQLSAVLCVSWYCGTCASGSFVCCSVCVIVLLYCGTCASGSVVCCSVCHSVVVVAQLSAVLSVS